MPIRTVFVEPQEEDISSRVYTLEDGKFVRFQAWNTFPFNDLTTEQTHERIKVLFGGFVVQMARKINNYKYEYFSCKNVAIYKVINHGSGWECDCLHYEWFVKTGMKTKPCHHVAEVILFEGSEGHLQNSGKSIKILS